MRDIDGILYCNDGDWVESLTALGEGVDGTLEIVRWAEHMPVAARVRRGDRKRAVPA
jgi:predicted Zn-dependent protease